jgi:hypothetical protein
MQKLILTGHVGNDATIADLQSGKQVINFNVAVTEKYKDREPVTTWYKCAWFINNASIAQYIKKGTKVLVEGNPILKYTPHNKAKHGLILNVLCKALNGFHRTRITSNSLKTVKIPAATKTNNRNGHPSPTDRFFASTG